jgi:resuscitation-promoting factor RpfA
MKHAKPLLRPGMTAIAAVLALSSTPLLAQAVEVAPTAPAAPVIAAPPAPDPAPATATTAPNAAGLNIPKITVNLDDAPQAAPASEPVAMTPAPAKPAAVRTAKAAPAAPKVAEPVTPSEPLAMAKEEVAPITPPVVAEPPVAAAPAPAPQPVAKAQPVESDNDVLPIAGAVGLGALALAGGAFALTRRKRRDEDQDFAAAPVQSTASDDLLLTEPMPTYAVSSTAPAPMQVEGPATTLPAGFDLSRFGRHVQAAYRGPTADNPSLSLRNRLRRASFYDQRERMAAEASGRQQPLPPRTDWVAPKQDPAVAARTNDHIVTRPSNWRQPGFRPAYQS